MEKAKISCFLTIWLFLPRLTFLDMVWLFFSNDVWQPC